MLTQNVVDLDKLEAILRAALETAGSSNLVNVLATQQRLRRALELLEDRRAA